MPAARPVAFYLPQFHPVPENDAFWGKGFTEWANVAKARPLFRGHVQPHLPADLGFYDLRIPEVREAQADLARAAGIEAFCYWHYWFGNGRRVLERPLEEVLKSGKPDFGFCLGWANQSWTGRWHGSDDVIIEQSYPGLSDIDAHFNHVLPYFRDDRYFRISGRCVFLVYAPAELPEPRTFIDRWQELAREAGIEPIYFISVSHTPRREEGYDGSVPNAPLIDMIHSRPPWWLRPVNWASWRFCRKPILEWFYRHRSRPFVIQYRHYVDAYPFRDLYRDEFPCVVPNWDNTPRCGSGGYLLAADTPELYANVIEKAVASFPVDRPDAERVLFIKSWNEWAEGNYMEPDAACGHARIETLARVIDKSSGRVAPHAAVREDRS
jgi:hypothetical protein